MYTRLARRLCVSSSVNEVTRAVPMVGANAVQLDVDVLVIGAGATVSILIQGSNDLSNWLTLGTTKVTTVGYTSTAKATSVPWRFVRVRLSSNAAGTSILALGLNATGFGWILPQPIWEPVGTDTRVARRFSIPSGSVDFTRALSMSGANAVQVDFEVLVGAVAFNFNFKVTLEGSNDLQNWSEIGASVIQQGVGFNSSLKQGSIAFRFVRLRFASTGTIYIVAAQVNTMAA